MGVTKAQQVDLMRVWYKLSGIWRECLFHRRNYDIPPDLRANVIWFPVNVSISLILDDFAISANADKLQLVEQANYLGLWVRNDLSWDVHILELCRKIYHVHMFCRPREILPSLLLLNIYKSFTF